MIILAGEARATRRGLAAAAFSVRAGELLPARMRIQWETPRG